MDAVTQNKKASFSNAFRFFLSEVMKKVVSERARGLNRPRIIWFREFKN